MADEQDQDQMEGHTTHWHHVRLSCGHQFDESVPLTVEVHEEPTRVCGHPDHYPQQFEAVYVECGLRRAFRTDQGGLLLLHQSAASRSEWSGYCPHCGCLQHRYTCYRCGTVLEEPANIRLTPPYGSLDSRSQNWLCPDCLVAFQEWANAEPGVVANTKQVFTRPTPLPRL